MIAVKNCLEEIEQAARQKKKLLAILIDPDKFDTSQTSEFLKKIPGQTSHIFVGGSTVPEGVTCDLVKTIKQHTNLPVIIFPGDQHQISPHADGLLFLSLISGRNPEYLIEQQVRAAAKLRGTQIEVIPTGYILIDGGKKTSVERVSNTRPMSQDRAEDILNTALAGQFSGKKLIYLEAGSGAAIPVSEKILNLVKSELQIPLIVGGGIRNDRQLQKAYDAGADMVVIGTALENNIYNL